MNKERARRLIEQGKMTRPGFAALAAVQNAFTGKFVIPPDVLKRLQQDKTVWKHFQRFPPSYKRIRIGWIEGARKRPQEFEKRLRYFLKRTAKNERFGMVQ